MIWRQNKSLGPNNINPKILKETKSKIVDTLWITFNLPLSQGSFPSDWITASVTPIFKLGDRKHPRELQAYWFDIVVGKMLESIIRNKIVSYFERHS